MTEKEVYTDQSVTDQLEWIWWILESIVNGVHSNDNLYIQKILQVSWIYMKSNLII